MNLPLVSVVMSVYNAEKYLKEAIDSILNQTYKNFEFIIINDGSNDKSLQIIEQYLDKRIVLINNDKNLKLVASLNKGLDLAKGKYIARMDADDISLPKRLEKQVDFMEHNLDVGICGTWLQHFPIGPLDKNRETPTYFDVLRYPSPFGHPTVIMRKSVLDTFHLRYNPNFEYCEDYDLWSRAIRYTKFANLQEVLFKYREHQSSISVSKSKEQAKKTRTVQLNMIHYLTDDEFLFEKLKAILLDTSTTIIKKKEISLLSVPFIKTKEEITNE